MPVSRANSGLAVVGVGGVGVASAPPPDAWTTKCQAILASRARGLSASCGRETASSCAHLALCIISRCHGDPETLTLLGRRQRRRRRRVCVRAALTLQAFIVTFMFTDGFKMCILLLLFSCLFGFLSSEWDACILFMHYVVSSANACSADILIAFIR